MRFGLPPYLLALTLAVSTSATGCTGSNALSEGLESDADGGDDGGTDAEPAGGPCIPGRSVGCACETGGTGAQLCREDRTFSPCVCVSDASVSDDARSSGRDAAPAPSDRGLPPIGDGSSARPDASGRAEDMAARPVDGTPGCVEGQLLSRACGLNGRGHEDDPCRDGAFADFGPCADPDVCVDGVMERDPCGAHEAGSRTRTCVDGQPGPFSECQGAPPCPDVRNPACRGPQPEQCNGLDDDLDGLADESLADGPAPIEPFAAAVEDSVERGLAFLRMAENGAGHFGLFNEGNQDGFLGLLAFLERRSDAGRGPVVGYAGLSADDQAMAVRLMRGIIDGESAFRDSANAPSAYRIGGGLMAMGPWLRTGGPLDVGASVTVEVAAANGAAAFQRVQGVGAAQGGIGYLSQGNDLSTTHFAVNGLAAVGEHLRYQDLGLMLAGNRTADGGFTYAPNVAPASHAMTSAAAWVAHLGREALPGALETDALSWLSGHYTATQMGFLDQFNNSAYYGRWTMVKAFMVGVQPDDPSYARLDPGSLGFPETAPGYFFDLAYTLMQWQLPTGQWSRNAGAQGGNPAGWTGLSTHVFALLVLERSTGGVAPDPVGRPARPACADGLDNDGDGHTDFPGDAECRFSCTRSETVQPACDDELDQDADGLTDFPADPGCASAASHREDGRDCDNGRDDDADGLTDWPADPGCAAAADDEERGAVPQPACANRRDDDGDGAVDLAGDFQCYSAAQGDEAGRFLCPTGAVPTLLPEGDGVYSGTTELAPDALQGRCGGLGSAEVHFAIVTSGPERIVMDTRGEGTSFDTVLYVRHGCAEGSEELGCNQDARPDEPGSRLVVRVPGAGVYFVTVDGNGSEGAFELSVNRTPLPGACNDAFDNDRDGAIDLLDDGCEAAFDATEGEPSGLPACLNGLDDDGDGWIDFPDEPGCEGPGDAAEVDPLAAPDCANARDDDGDGDVDYPWDAACRARGWETEFGAEAACGNRLDDDADGLIDHPWEPGCAQPTDDDEADAEGPALGFANGPTPGCANGRDDDSDGLVDFPGDPGCHGAGDLDESDHAVAPPACANDLDDDADGVVDWPLDPGCAGRGDVSEGDPLVAPPCSNGVDDDGDGQADFPADRGCVAPSGPDEADDLRASDCGNGFDDDGDGAVDLSDPGCAEASGASEVDGDVAPRCADGADNDGDGLADWPLDPQCEGAGDACEQLGDTLCDGRCVSLRSDADHCGACGLVCAEGVSCADGFCGGRYTFEGVSNNVPVAALIGWQVCHSDTYAATASLDDLRRACDGARLLLGCRRLDQPTLQVAAMGDRAQVFRSVGSAGNASHDHNGVQWYLDENSSFGFAPAGVQIDRRPCDLGGGEANNQRLCWQTLAGALSPGYRCGQDHVNGSNQWERVIFETAD